MTMKARVLLVSLLAGLMGVSAASADMTQMCSAMTDNLLETMRTAEPDEDAAKEVERRQLLERVEQRVKAARDQGVDPCELWQEISIDVGG